MGICALHLFKQLSKPYSDLNKKNVTSLNCSDSPSTVVAVSIHEPIEFCVCQTDAVDTVCIAVSTAMTSCWRWDMNSVNVLRVIWREATADCIVVVRLRKTPLGYTRRLSKDPDHVFDSSEAKLQTTTSGPVFRSTTALDRRHIESIWHYGAHHDCHLETDPRYITLHFWHGRMIPPALLLMEALQHLGASCDLIAFTKTSENEIAISIPFGS